MPPVRVTDWRADAFRVIAPRSSGVPAVASGRAARERGAVQPVRGCCVATPVHLLADMSSVRLPADGILDAEPAEAEALAADFNRVCARRRGALVSGRARRCCFACFDAPLRVDDQRSRGCAGRDIWSISAARRRMRRACGGS